MSKKCSIYTYQRLILQIRYSQLIKYNYYYLQCQEKAIMGKKTQKIKSNRTQSIQKLAQSYPIIKDKKITIRQLREKMFEKLNAQKGRERVPKDFKQCEFNHEKRCNEITSLIRQEQVTCPICYDAMVGPVLVECGHVFCLSCIECAYFTSQQCPLCRKALEDDIFNVSTQIKNLVNIFKQNNMGAEEKIAFQQRQITFASSQAKRKVPCDLELGDYVDINFKNKWRQGKVQQIEENSVLVNITDQKSKTIESLKLNIHSRRLARHRTFSKPPPLKPTYFSRDFNLREPVLLYIVERPTLYQRMPTFRVENQPTVIQETPRPNWDQFENVENENNWIFSDDIRLTTGDSGNIWDPSSDDLEQPILI